MPNTTTKQRTIMTLRGSRDTSIDNPERSRLAELDASKAERELHDADDIFGQISTDKNLSRPHGYTHAVQQLGETTTGKLIGIYEPRLDEIDRKEKELLSPEQRTRPLSIDELEAAPGSLRAMTLAADIEGIRRWALSLDGTSLAKEMLRIFGADPKRWDPKTNPVDKTAAIALSTAPKHQRDAIETKSGLKIDDLVPVYRERINPELFVTLKSIRASRERARMDFAAGYEYLMKLLGITLAGQRERVDAIRNKTTV